MDSCKFFVACTFLDRDVLPFAGASNFSLKLESISFGNVLPRSHMSTNFLTLAYYTQLYVSQATKEGFM